MSPWNTTLLLTFFHFKEMLVKINNEGDYLLDCGFDGVLLLPYTIHSIENNKRKLKVILQCIGKTSLMITYLVVEPSVVL